MEPVTHVLTGACLARTGLNRRAAYATAAMAVAAEFPDVDTLWSLRGPVSGFEHHRGITHTFLGIPFEAALLLLGFVLFDRLRHHGSKPQTDTRILGRPAPVRWGMLYVLIVLALLSHLFLDYTNNYGIRPFFPFQNAWYAGSIVFIFDPLIFLLLLTGLLLPSLFALIGQEVGGRKERYRGRGWARAVLVLIVLLWAVRWIQHSRAIELAAGQTLRAPSTPMYSNPSSDDLAAGLPAPEPTRPLLGAARVWASPDPLSIFRWYTVTDFGPAYTLGLADTRVRTLVPNTILVKPAESAALLAAQNTRLGRVYLDWSAMPMIRLTDGVPPGFQIEPVIPVGTQTVTFSDLRFAGDLPFLDQSDRPPLSGQLIMGSGNLPLAEGMDGRFDH